MACRQTFTLMILRSEVPAVLPQSMTSHRKSSSRRQRQLPNSALSFDGTLVEPVNSARDLGIYIDFDLLMRTHVQRTVSRCFAVLRQLRKFRRSVPTDTFQTLVVSVLAGLPVYLVRRLQSVLNAAARLTYHLRRSDHITVTDALVCLHWLRMPERVQYKIQFSLLIPCRS